MSAEEYCQQELLFDGDQSEESGQKALLTLKDEEHELVLDDKEAACDIDAVESLYCQDLASPSQHDSRPVTSTSDQLQKWYKLWMLSVL